MRCVVYDFETMEPITVVSLKQRWVDHLLRHECVVLPIIREPRAVRDDEPIKLEASSVSLRLIRVRNAKGTEALLLLVDDPENAMLLKATTLPGQSRVMQEAYESGYGAGVTEALRRLLG